jgi:hypothetical protein
MAQTQSEQNGWAVPVIVFLWTCLLVALIMSIVVLTMH